MRDDLVLLGRTLATSMQSPSGFGMEMIESELKRDAKKEDSEGKDCSLMLVSSFWRMRRGIREEFSYFARNLQ